MSLSQWKLRLSAALVFIILLSGATAWWRSFSSMAPFDDEGAMIGVLQRAFHGEVLYDKLNSIYGPLFYAYEYVPQAITGLAVSHDTVRMASVFFWVAACVALFVLVYRATGSLVLALAAHILGFRALDFIAGEPAHPQELCILLLLGIPLAACARRPVAMAWFGVLFALITLTKVNLGIIVAAAFAVVFAMSWRRTMLGWAIVAGTAAGALALPFVLMASHLSLGWGIRFALLVFLSLIPAILAASATPIEPVAIRHLGIGLATAIGCATLIYLVLAAHGTTLGGMIYSMILWPRAHFAQTWNIPMPVATANVIWAAVNLPLAWLAIRGRLSPAMVAILKLALAALVLVIIGVRLFGGLVGAAAPMLWLVAIPPPDDRHRNGLLRPLLAVLGVLQVMYAYPVAGSQVAFITVWMVAAAALCVSDVLPWLATLAPPAASRMVPAAAAVLAVAISAAVTYRAFAQFRLDKPLNLPGAEYLRLDPEWADSLRRLDRAAHDCSILMTAPGIVSLNMFSGVRAPTGIRAGPWTLFMSDDEQANAIRELAAEARPCVVYHPGIAKTWIRNGPVQSRLMDYILDRFQTEFETGGYRFMLPKRGA